ncbi:hypothetical protein Tco_1177825 [Tanacetum coccineum]
MWYPRLNIYMAVRFLRISVSKIITKSRKFQIMAVDAFMFTRNLGHQSKAWLSRTYIWTSPSWSSFSSSTTAFVQGHSLSITDSLLNRKSNKLKPLLWSSLKSAEQGSMWAEIQNPDEATQVLEINMSELESLFLRESRGRTSGRKIFTSSDQLDNIIQFCPTKEEMDQLKDFSKGDRDELGKCEQVYGASAVLKTFAILCYIELAKMLSSLVTSKIIY